MIFGITQVQNLKPSSNNDIISNDSIHSHIMQKPPPKFNMSYSSMEPVLFEKLHNITLSHSVFRITTFSSLTQLNKHYIPYSHMPRTYMQTWKQYIQN